MLSRKAIEAYLFFLLRHRVSVSIVISVITVVLATFMWFHMHVRTNFFDLYPPNHPYIKLYQQYRPMFGTANTLLLVVEVKKGTIFDNPETVQKVDRLTLALLHDLPGVNGEQVLSITHPKLKTTLTAGSGIKVVPLMYPRVPDTYEDLQFLKLKVYSTEGVKGPFVSDDDKATLIVAGFWEEYFDLPTMWAKVKELIKQEEDENTKIYVTGPPILYAYFLEMGDKMSAVLAASIVMILLILWVEFRSWQGVVIPAFSGTLSAVWGLGFGGLCHYFYEQSGGGIPYWMDLSLDPLVLVIPLLISARAHSHSVQSMERYHEEYHRLGNKDEAIVKSYAEIYAPAMVSILADGLAILTLLIASIPLIRKLSILCSFWIVSIFVSVVTLHPIILSFTPPPQMEHRPGDGALERFMSWMMLVAGLWLFWLFGHLPNGIVGVLFSFTLLGLGLDLFGVRLPVYSQGGVFIAKATDALGAVFGGLYRRIEAGLIWLATGWRRQMMCGFLFVLVGFGGYFSHQLKVGDTTPGGALLYADHPYNVAFGKVNAKFVGASQLVIIAEGKARCTVGGKPCEGNECTQCAPDDAKVCGVNEKCQQIEGSIKNVETLTNIDLFARYMAEREEVGGTVTATTLLKKIFRTFHEADPKWELLPTRDDHVSQLFFLLTSSTRRGEMDRFFDINYANATIQVFYKDYTHETIEKSLARAKEYIAAQGNDDPHVRYRLAGGLIGILAAVNEEVEWSYWWNIRAIILVVFLLSYATYVSFFGALIVMFPSLVAQPMSEATMYLLGIDMNINSLPVAAVGIGIGIDYGYYVLSRIVEELKLGEGFDVAIRRMFETTGKTVLFMGVSLTASIIFWVVFPMKFQAEMALLLILLLAFHLMGALMFIPPMVSLLKPKFAIRYAEERQRLRNEAEAAAQAATRRRAAGR